MSERAALLATLRAALPELRQAWPIRSLSLFGSVMRGEATESSDLDVLIEFARPVPLSAFLALEDRLSRLTGRQIDLVTRASLKPHIGADILREAVPL